MANENYDPNGKQCPFKLANAKNIMTDTTCQTDCAWYITKTKCCAIKEIADLIH